MILRSRKAEKILQTPRMPRFNAPATLKVAKRKKVMLAIEHCFSQVPRFNVREPFV